MLSFGSLHTHTRTCVCVRRVGIIIAHSNVFFQSRGRLLGSKMKLLYALIITSFFVVQSFARLRTLFHTLGRSRRADLQSNYKYATKTFEVPVSNKSKPVCLDFSYFISPFFS